MLLSIFSFLLTDAIIIIIKNEEYRTAPEGIITQRVKARAKPVGGGVRGTGQYDQKKGRRIDTVVISLITNKSFFHFNAYILTV